MLGFLRLPPRPLPNPIAETPPSAAYLALAGELGFTPGVLMDLRLREFMREQGMPIYDWRQVRPYMDALAQREFAIWKLRPLRERDKLPRGWWIRGHGLFERIGRWSHDDPGCGVYDKLVPERVLKDVQRLEQRFPDSHEKLLFYVTDYKPLGSEKVDPFIMVTTLQMPQNIVFGVWDEPGFTG